MTEFLFSTYIIEPNLTQERDLVKFVIEPWSETRTSGLISSSSSQTDLEDRSTSSYWKFVFESSLSVMSPKLSSSILLNLFLSLLLIKFSIAALDPVCLVCIYDGRWLKSFPQSGVWGCNEDIAPKVSGCKAWLWNTGHSDRFGQQTWCQLDCGGVVVSKQLNSCPSIVTSFDHQGKSDPSQLYNSFVKAVPVPCGNWPKV